MLKGNVYILIDVCVVDFDLNIENNYCKDAFQI